MTKGTFGDNLKREREMRGVSLDEIATATRIAPRFLVAIETEQWDQLPGGVFNRGFVRAVAHYLGLDEENIVAEYALAVNDRPTVPVWTGTPPPLAPDRRWVGLVIAVGVIIVILAGCWFTTRKLLAWRANRRAAQAASLSDAPSPGSASAGVTAPIAASSASHENSADTVPAAESTASNAPTGSSSTIVGSTSSNETPTAVTPADSPMQLKIETVKKTKVTVETDTHRVFDGTVKMGDTHTFSAKDHFQISTRDAGALVIQLNGKTLAPIGPLGHPGKITLSRDSLKNGAGGDN